MSKGRRKVRLFAYDNRSFSLYEKRFTAEYKFMKVSHEGDDEVYSIKWKDVVILSQSMVINPLNIKQITQHPNMNSTKKSKLLDEVFARRKAEKQERNKLLEKLDRKNLYGSKSQKVYARKQDTSSRKENKNDFGGSQNPEYDSSHQPENPTQLAKKEDKSYLKDMSYKRMKVDKSVCHDPDQSKLPQDAVIIKPLYKYTYKQVSYILEHQ